MTPLPMAGSARWHPTASPRRFEPPAAHLLHRGSLPAAFPHRQDAAALQAKDRLEKPNGFVGLRSPSPQLSSSALRSSPAGLHLTPAIPPPPHISRSNYPSSGRGGGASIAGAATGELLRRGWVRRGSASRWGWARFLAGTLPPPRFYLESAPRFALDSCFSAALPLGENIDG